jgi:alpha-mannosidase
VFELYEDRPTAFDAWELEPYLEQTRREVAGAESWRVEVRDRLRIELAFRHRVGERSELEQRVRLDAGARRLEFRCRVNWRERNTLLRVAFPLRVRADEATLGAQFGVHRLPTHRNTDADLARFEAPALGFADLSEHELGAALLSSTSYGFGAVGGTLRLSLLRAPTDPDPEADQGEHELAWAIQPHRGSWQHAAIARAATAFERPPVLVPGAAPGGPFAELDSDDLTLDTLKRSEDGRDLVMRLHEAHGGRGVARLRLAVEHGAAVRATALEDPGGELARDADAIVIPYRPFELITLRLTL